MPRRSRSFRFTRALSVATVLIALSAPSVRADTEHTVDIRGFVFNPGTLTVAVGDTVTWTNFDSVRHTATGSSFDSGSLAEGESYSMTFTEPGTYNYQCTPHPQMRGRIVVEADAAQQSAQPVPNTSMAAASPAVSLLLGGLAVVAVAGMMAVRRRGTSDH